MTLCFGIEMLLIALAKPLIMLFNHDPVFIEKALPMVRLSFLGYFAGILLMQLSALE